MGMTVNAMASNELQMNFVRFNADNNLSPTRTASDDPAGSAIAETMTAEIRGLDQGSANTADMNNLVRTAEGALSTVSDRLQRVNELTLQAQNGTFGEDDRAIFQREIDMILEDIGNTARNTTFNNINILDGSFADRNTASGADGTGMQITIGDMSVDALGLEGFNVSDPNALDILSQAMDTVAEQRSELGAISNTFQHTINSNDITSLNLQAARSGIIDTDYAREITDQNRDRALEQYRVSMQQSDMQQQERVMQTLMR
jgi:flagellin